MRVSGADSQSQTALKAAPTGAASRTASPPRSRITSYNVCYTKLLRIGAEFYELPGDNEFFFRPEFCPGNLLAVSECCVENLDLFHFFPPGIQGRRKFDRGVTEFSYNFV